MLIPLFTVGQMTERVDLRLSSPQIFQKGKGCGGTAVSEPIMRPRKTAERFISVKVPRL